MQQPAQNTILFIRLSAIGDIVMASGLPTNLKFIYPNSKIVWLVETPYQDLVKHHSDVDEVIVWPKQQWRELAKQKKYGKLIASFMAFRKALRKHRFTHAVEAQGLLKSAFLAWLSGAQRRIGFKSKEKGHWLLNQVHDKIITPHISSEYAGLGRELGAHSYKLSLTFPAATTHRVSEIIASEGIYSDFLVVCPFTTRPQKHWPHEHWKILIGLLQKHYGLPVVIVGSPTDKDTADDIAQSSNNVYNFAGKTNLLESAAVINQAAAAIGVDTGMTHIATTLKRPTIALFGSTCPYLRTDNPTTRVIYKSLPCAPCKRNPTCSGSFDCMASISPEEVAQALGNLL